MLLSAVRIAIAIKKSLLGSVLPFSLISGPFFLLRKGNKLTSDCEVESVPVLVSLDCFRLLSEDWFGSTDEFFSSSFLHGSADFGYLCYDMVTVYIIILSCFNLIWLAQFHSPLLLMDQDLKTVLCTY